MKFETGKNNDFNITKFSNILDECEAILAKKLSNGIKKDADWIEKMNAVIDRMMPASTPIVLLMTSAASLANTLKDHTPVDPYGPLAMVPYRSRGVIVKP